MPEVSSAILDNFPDVSTERTGWPWLLEPKSIDYISGYDGSCEWPKITVFTPNYNYGHYLEETIRSVLLQGYPNLEYIIIDGGSTDNSVEVIKKYEPWLTYWTSEADRGQTHAINKGLAKATGEIFNWINSDDILMPGSLFAIAEGIKDYDAFAGVVTNFDEVGNRERVIPKNITATGLLTKFNTTNRPGKHDTVYHQPGFWFRTEFLKNIGSLNENLQIQFDFDRVVRYVHHYPNVNYSDRSLVDFRCHQEQKTAPDKIEQEGQTIVKSILIDPEYQQLTQPANLWLSRLVWYENLAEFDRQTDKPKLLQSLKILLLSCRNPHAYWTRYTFGSIRKILTKTQINE
jgi:glycosyltransferase involved in cell wall biosynthesis